MPVILYILVCLGGECHRERVVPDADRPITISECLVGAQASAAAWLRLNPGWTFGGVT